MIRLMIMALVCAAPNVGGAQVLPQFVGSWDGDGQVVRGDEPAERLRCRIRIEDQGRAQFFMVGRCATAQGSNSFAVTLSEDATGRLIAESRAETLDELPQTAEGRASAGLLEFETAQGSALSLRRVGDTLTLAIIGEQNGQSLVGQAQLTPRN